MATMGKVFGLKSLIILPKRFTHIKLVSGNTPFLPQFTNPHRPNVTLISLKNKNLEREKN